MVLFVVYVYMYLEQTNAECVLSASEQTKGWSGPNVFWITIQERCAESPLLSFYITTGSGWGCVLGFLGLGVIETGPKHKGGSDNVLSVYLPHGFFHLEIRSVTVAGSRNSPLSYLHRLQMWKGLEAGRHEVESVSPHGGRVDSTRHNSKKILGLIPGPDTGPFCVNFPCYPCVWFLQVLWFP